MLREIAAARNRVGVVHGGVLDRPWIDTVAASAAPIPDRQANNWRRPLSLPRLTRRPRGRAADHRQETVAAGATPFFASAEVFDSDGVIGRLRRARSVFARRIRRQD